MFIIFFVYSLFISCLPNTVCDISARLRRTDHFTLHCACYAGGWHDLDSYYLNSLVAKWLKRVNRAENCRIVQQIAANFQHRR